MKPKSNLPKDQFHLFQASFLQMLNPNHPLVQMADKINWENMLRCNVEVVADVFDMQHVAIVNAWLELCP